MFYEFDQNNSSGTWVENEEAGIAQRVIIEADDVAAAVSKAEDIGLYFDGAGDCPCCGSRWNKPWDGEGTEGPELYGEPFDSKNTWGYSTAVHTEGGGFDWYEATS